MSKRADQNPDKKTENIDDESKENETSNKQVERKSSYRKCDRHVLENINQNVNSSTVVSNTFNVEYSHEQQILKFTSPHGSRIIKTLEISPIVDKEAPGLRRSLRNIPKMKPSILQRMHSRTKIQLARNVPNLENVGTEFKQYKRDCLHNIKENSWVYVIDRRFLQAIDPLMKNRNQIIMWLIEINKKFQERCCVVLNTIRIFDILLASVYVPGNLYALVASTAFWMSAKLDNSHFVDIKCLIRSNGSFSKDNYFKMERKIFHLLNYNVRMVDPTLIVDYICMKMERGMTKPMKGNIVLLYHGAYFFLELFALDCMYSSTDPIGMAIGALRNATKLLPDIRNNIDTLDAIISILKLESRDISPDSSYVESRMMFLFSRACDRTHIFHDLFKKYCAHEYGFVTKEFC